MIVPWIMWMLMHPSTKSFCERHLVGWDLSDPRTREYLEKLKEQELIEQELIEQELIEQELIEQELIEQERKERGLDGGMGD